MLINLTQEPHLTRAADYTADGYTVADYIHDHAHSCDDCGAAFDRAEDLQEQDDGGLICSICIHDRAEVACDHFWSY